FSIEVEGNQPPEFTSDPDLDAQAGESYQYIATAQDPQDGAITITAVNIPEWLSLSDQGDGSAILEGIPDLDDIGPHGIVIEAESEFGLSVQQDFEIQVDGEIEPPVFLSEPDQEAYAGTTWTYQVSVQDPQELGVHVNAVTLPDWLSFVDQGGGEALLEGAPDFEDVGVHLVVLEAQNQFDERAEQAFELSVVADSDDQLSLIMESYPSTLQAGKALTLHLEVENPGDGMAQEVSLSASIYASEAVAIQPMDEVAEGCHLDQSRHPWELECSLGDMEGSSFQDILFELESSVAGDVFMSAELFSESDALIGDHALAELSLAGHESIGIGADQVLEYVAQRVVVGDLTGNSVSDLVLATGSGEPSLLLHNDGESDFEVQQTLAEELDIRDALLADISGDGRQELVLVNANGPSLVKGMDGDLRYETVSELESGGAVSGLTTDLTGDGWQDLLLLTGSSEILLFVNQGGQLTPAGGFPLPEASIAAAADLTGDGRPELILGWIDGRVLIIRPVIDSLLAAHGEQAALDYLILDEYNVGPGLLDIATGDITGSGYPDMAVARGKDGRPHGKIPANAVYFNDGSGHLGHHLDLGRVDSVAVELQDLTGNGRLDLMFGNSRGGHQVYRNHRNGVIRLADRILKHSGSRQLLSADLDGDGRWDWVSLRDDGETVDLYPSSESPLFPRANLGLSVSLGDEALDIRDSRPVSIRVTNEGPDISEAVTLNIEVPAGISIDSGEHDCEAVGGGLQCALGDIPVGGEKELALKLEATSPGQFEFQFSLTADTEDPQPENAQYAATWVVEHGGFRSGCSTGLDPRDWVMWLILLLSLQLFRRRASMRMSSIRSGGGQ
ncbi:FG-GAP-like repeat-containing protein, partial [Gammaproteobacteria bacterium AB-CW1]|nr:FG-GAP-like repeat-containing protein [Gammaproteobacteria bacterium AB-CW1]